MPKRRLLVIVSVIVVAGAGVALFLAKSGTSGMSSAVASFGPDERQRNSAHTLPPSDFESAVFAWLASNSDDVALVAQLARVRAVSREHTVVGCYSSFVVADDAPSSARPYATHGPLDGPQFRSPVLKYGGGTLLWFAAGRAVTLEIYTYDDLFPEDHADLGAFELLPADGDSK